MGDGDAQTTPTPGEGLYRELLWVHAQLRADLDRVRALAAGTLDGAPASEIASEIDELRTNSPLWRLKMGCLAHCRFVHHHHRLEDLALFPALLQANPALTPVVEKLAADHRSIAARVDAVEAAVAGLTEDGGAGPAERELVAAELEALAAALLEHLAYEEEHVAETMRAMTAF